MGNASRIAYSSPNPSVHPHGCGERCRITRTTTREGGSSPRLWGTLDECEKLTSAFRFIPTAVGNAPLRTVVVQIMSVHPHGCGERGRYHYKSTIITGSSPRLWGTLKFSAIQPKHVRFIPTAVGNARAGRRPGGCWTVHPHGCGSNSHFGDYPVK